MPRRCTICDHPDRNAIDAALVTNGPLRGIARTFALSEDALFRHRSDHLPSHLAKAKEAEETTHADSLLGQLLSLNRETFAILKEARDGEDNELALKAIARAEKQIELQAKLLGELQEGTTVNILILPEWARLRSAVIHALTPFPEARMAVLNALQGIQ